MTEAEILIKIHNDLEILKQDISEIKQVMNLEPKLKKEVIEQVKNARERISKGQFVSNEKILEEFDLE